MKNENILLAKKLRTEAAKLSHNAEQLLMAAKILEGSIPEASSSLAVETTTSSPPLTRKEQVRALVDKYGSLSVNEVVNEHGVPRGTASNILSEKNGYKRDEEGKWFYSED